MLKGHGESIVLRHFEKFRRLKEGELFEQGKGFDLKKRRGAPPKPDVLIKMPGDGDEQSEVVIVDSKVF